MNIEFEFSIDEKQDDLWITVVGGTTPDLVEAVREAEHYAAMYAQDGPVRVKVFRREILSERVIGGDRG